jgi:glycosyltransferase involved in cell wall biosynthesis
MKYRVCHLFFHPVSKLPPLLNELVVLSRKGWPTVVYGGMGGGEEPGIDLPCVDVRRVTIRLRGVSSSGNRVMKLLRYAEYSIRIFIVALRCPAGIIVAHDLTSLPAAWLAARLRRKAIVYNAHEILGETNEQAAPLQSLWRRLDGFFCPRVDAMIVPEENRARIFVEDYGARKMPVVVPNVPLLRAPNPGGVLREFFAAKGAQAATIMLYQGLFEEGRGLDAMIEAMRSVTEGTVLVLIGGGTKEYEARLRELIDKHGLAKRVFTMPWVPYDDLHGYTCSADAGVLLYRNDGRNNYYCAPNKLYEYMHAGLPVVTSNFPGLKTLVEGEDIGICVDPDSAEEIARAFNALSDETFRKEKGNRALRIAREKYHWEMVVEKIFELYTTLRG